MIDEYEEFYVFQPIGLKGTPLILLWWWPTVRKRRIGALVKMFILVLVLVTMCIVPAQSQRVIDAELRHVSSVAKMTYEIGVNNVGDTEWAKVMQDCMSPASVAHEESGLVYPKKGETKAEPTIALTPVDTTECLSRFLGDFEPGQKKRDVLVVTHKSDFEVDYEKNMSKVRGEGLKEVISEPLNTKVGSISITTEILDEKGRLMSGRSMNFTNDNPVWYLIQVLHCRYEHIPLPYSRNGYGIATLGKTGIENNYSLDASVEMGSDSGVETFTLDYKANATDSVIETKDATGWSNRIGSRRIDFEYDTFMSSKQLNITNVLKDSAPFPVEAGGGKDWLSCCFGGTEPPYYPPMDINESWPNDGIYRTLSPVKKLPTVSRSQNCTVDPWGQLRCSEPTYCNDFSCNDTKCPGFGCIYEFGPIERS